MNNLDRGNKYAGDKALWMRKAYMEGFKNQSITTVVRPGDRSEEGHYSFIPKGVYIPVRFINTVGERVPGATSDLLPDDGTTVMVTDYIVKSIGDLTHEDLKGCPPDCATQELVRYHLALTYNEPLPKESDTVTLWRFEYRPNTNEI